MNQRRSIQDAIEQGPMTRFQVIAIGVCLVINMLDGFDVLALSFTAASITDEWSLDHGTLGVALSAGLVGMTLGSLLIAPLADRWGRRPVILVCLFIMSLGMFATGFSKGVASLAAFRVVTGLGIGGMLASLNTIVAEYSSGRRRDFSVSLLQAGYPIGATIGGLIATYLVVHHGWRSVFVGGALVSLAMIPLVIWRVPESIGFLLSRRPKGFEPRVQQLLNELNLKDVDPLPDKSKSEQTSSLSQILGTQIRGMTFCLWAAFFLVMFSFYFVLSWTPKLLVDSGLSQVVGISGGVIMNVGGIVGILLLGLGTQKFGAQRLIGTYMIATAFAMVAFGLIGTQLIWMVITAIVIGFFLFGSIVGLYVVTPRLYPATVRTTGTGWAIGIGRIGAVLGPYLGGLAREAEWSRPLVFTAFAVPMIIAALTLWQIQSEKAAH